MDFASIGALEKAEAAHVVEPQDLSDRPFHVRLRLPLRPPPGPAIGGRAFERVVDGLVDGDCPPKLLA